MYDSHMLASICMFHIHENHIYEIICMIVIFMYPYVCSIYVIVIRMHPYVTKFMSFYIYNGIIYTFIVRNNHPCVKILLKPIRDTNVMR